MKSDGEKSILHKWRGRMNRFRRVPWKMKLLLFTAFILMGLIRIVILIIPFRYIAPMLGVKNGNSTIEEKREVLIKASKIGWAVETMSRFTPWESKCLVRAITAQILLRVVATPSTLYLGMSKDEASKLIAHAWLRCGELILTGASESRNFQPIAQFASLIDRNRNT
jgi:hypothetical protein